MNITDQTLEQRNLALHKGGITVATGLVAYDLEPQAKLMYPVLTPLRNLFPRVGGGTGTAVNYRVITGINTGTVSPGIAEGQRGGIVTTAESDRSAAYITIGLDDSLSFEAELAAQGWDDAKNIVGTNLLNAVMIAEEQVLLGGNNSVALGTTPTCSLTPSNTGGVLTNAASPYHVRCVALSLSAYQRATVAAGLPLNQNYTRVDGSTGTLNAGTAQVSADATTTIASGTTGSIAATVAAVKGAVAYAWFWGSDATTNCKLGSITTINKVTIAADATGTQAVASNFASDLSRQSQLFDGLISIIAGSGSNSYFKSLDGVALSAASGGAIAELDTALQSFWDNYRVSPDLILVAGQQLADITSKLVQNGTTPLFRFNLDGGPSGQMGITGGAVVGSYLNKFAMGGGSLVKVMLHPNCPAGTILFVSTKLPYPITNTVYPAQVKCRRDYYQIDWPITKRQYEYGVYSDETFQVYFPPAFGMISNIAAG